MALSIGKKEKDKKVEEDVKTEDVKTEEAPATAATLDDLKKNADDYNHILLNAHKYIENPNAVIDKFAVQLESIGILDDVRQKGLAKMFEFIKPVDVLAEALKNYKKKKIFR